MRWMRLCPQCNQMREEHDYHGKDICYKCVYFEKTREEKKRKCLMCENLVPKGRWRYCGKECAAKGEIEMDNNYWLTRFKKNNANSP